MTTTSPWPSPFRSPSQLLRVSFGASPFTRAACEAIHALAKPCHPAAAGCAAARSTPATSTHAAKTMTISTVRMGVVLHDRHGVFNRAAHADRPPGQRRTKAMAIDFTLSPEVEAIRQRVRDFIQTVVKPGEEKIGDPDKLERSQYVQLLLQMRADAKAAGLWLPHMPKEWGGMGLGHVELALVQAEAAKDYYGPWVSKCRAHDAGNVHKHHHRA